MIGLPLERTCAECGALLFKGKAVSYERPPGSGYWDSEIEGDYCADHGQCARCGEEFCDWHLRDGHCPACWEETEREFEELEHEESLKQEHEESLKQGIAPNCNK